MVSAQSPAGVNIARSPQNGLGRLAAWCYDHRRRVLLGWLLAVVAAARPWRRRRSRGSRSGIHSRCDQGA